MIVAIGGGIGSGKSTLGQELRNQGFNVIDLDKVNKDLLGDSDYLAELYLTFPYAFEDGKLQKNLLKKSIFSSETEREKLNNLSHPKIKQKVLDIASKMDKDDLLFVEIPLLVGGDFASIFDKIIFVTASDEVRANRIASRDNVTVTDALKMIEAQKSEKNISDIADIIINNNGSPSELNQILTKLMTNFERKK